MKKHSIINAGISKYLVLLFISVNCLVYFPALSHAPKRDHLSYLAELADKNSFKDVITHTYSYNRTREFFTGDEWAFRPLFFLLLSFEKFLFGYKYCLWQLTGIILHLLVVWKLFTLLLSLRPGVFAFLFSMLFSVLTLPQEMIIWHHIHGYLLGLFFTLCSLKALVQYFYSNQLQNTELRWMSFTMMLAALCYEPSLIFPAAFVLIFFLSKLCTVCMNEKTREILACFLRKNISVIYFLLPLAVYTIWNFIDLRAHGMPLTAIKLKGMSLKILPSFFAILGESIAGPLMPFYLKIKYNYMSSIQLEEMDSFLQIFNTNTVGENINLYVVVFLTGAFVYGLILLIKNRKDIAESLKQNIKPTNAVFYVGIACLMFNGTLIFILCVIRGADYVQGFSTYHYYPIALFNIIFVYAIFSMVGDCFKEKKKFHVFLFTLLILATGLNSARSYEFNNRVKESHKSFLESQRIVGANNWHLSNRLLILGLDEYLENNLKEALNHFNDGVQINKYHPLLHNYRGLVYYELKEDDLAIRDFSKAIQLVPQSSVAYNNRGRVFLELNLYDKALADFSKAIDFDPENYMAYVNKGLVYCQMKHYDLAGKNFNTALSIKPGYLNTLNDRLAKYGKKIILEGERK